MSTICAISTAPGTGGIAVIRVSGPQAISAVQTLWKGRVLMDVQSHTVHLGRIVSPDGETVDEAVATVFRGPNSFTGDDVVELSVHGSPYVQQRLLQLLVEAGCRIAEPGEFTRRAFAAGRMDLAQAEAVADVIASRSRAAHRVAMQQMRGGFSRRLAGLRQSLTELASLLELELDFSEEDVEFADRERLISLATEVKKEVDLLRESFTAGNAIKNGVPVAIIGAPNVGKSSLLNLLLGEDRAIVSDIPGTTRDTVEDTIDINGITFRFIDTAGLRDASDPVERLGIDRSWDALRRARIILWVFSPDTFPHPTSDIITESYVSPTQTATLQNFSKILHERKAASAKVLIALNKSDLLSPEEITSASARLTNLLPPSSSLTNPIILSAASASGLPALREALVNASGLTSVDDNSIIVTNARHAEALTNASLSLARFLEALHTNLPTDLAAQDLRETLHHLGLITGSVSTLDILATIFSRFCVGK